MADYGAQDTSTTSLGANQFPISEAWTPNAGFSAVEGGTQTTDAGGKKSAPVRIEVKDGSDVAQGLTTDPAVTGDNSGTLSAKLRGLTKIFTDVWDSVNHRMKVDGSGVTQPVSGTFWQATQPVSGTFWQVTQPVSLSSLPSLVAGSALIGSVELVDSAGTNKLAIDASGRLTLIPNSSINNAQVAGTAVSVNQGNIDAGTQRVAQGSAGTGTKTSVASSATSVTILASNASRKGAMIYNESTQVLYLDLSGGTASNSSYSVQVAANGFFEVPGPAIYSGLITGIWSSAQGSARVTEFS